MKMIGNEVVALFVVVLTVTATGSLGGFGGYHFYTQPSGAAHVAVPIPLALPQHFAPVYQPRHYYSPPGNVYSGFSYQTNYQGGGSSQVVFVTGPQSKQLMEESIESLVRQPSDQAKLEQFGVTTRPNTKFHVLTVPPPLNLSSTSTISTVVGNHAVESTTPAPSFSSVPNTKFSGIPQASVYRVQVYPSHEPHFTPFPYNPFFAQFYNLISQINTTQNVPSFQQENANEAQESMIREIGTLPFVVSNDIDSTTTTISSAARTEIVLNTGSVQGASAKEASINTPEYPTVITYAQGSSKTEVPLETPNTESTVQETSSAPAGNNAEDITTENTFSDTLGTTTVAEETTVASATVEPSNSDANEHTTVEQMTEA